MKIYLICVVKCKVLCLFLQVGFTLGNVVGMYLAQNYEVCFKFIYFIIYNFILCDIILYFYDIICIHFVQFKTNYRNIFNLIDKSTFRQTFSSIATTLFLS